MRRSSQIFGFVLALTAFGCGADDEDERDEARAALDEARSSQADRYAPGSYQRAEEAYRDGAIDDEADAEDSDHTVEAIQSMARRAAQEAEAVREDAKAIAQENIREATLMLEIARAVARHQSASSGFDSHDLETMQRELEQAQEAFAAEDYATAGVIATDVIQQISQLERQPTT